MNDRYFDERENVQIIVLDEIKKNPISKAVKLADLRHNSDTTRLDNITDRDEKRLKKYAEAIQLLEDD